MAAEPESNQPAPAFASALVWNAAGGWQWFLGAGWVWSQDGGWIEHHAHPWWHQMPLDGLYVAGGGRWIQVTVAMLERHLILQFLPVQLRLASAIDPGGNLLVKDRRGRWHDAAELPVWLARSLTPKPLDAGERADLELLLRQPWPLSKATARKLIRGGTEHFRRVWSHVPEDRKLRRGRPSGHRVPDPSATVHPLREK
jgi:hypothetical protein